MCASATVTYWLPSHARLEPTCGACQAPTCCALYWCSCTGVHVLVFMYWCSLRAVLVFICTGVHFVLSLLVPTALHSQRSESEQRNQEGGSEAGAAMAQDPGVGLHADVQADHSNQLPRAAGAHWPESRQHALVLLLGFLSSIAALHVQTCPSHHPICSHAPVRFSRQLNCPHRRHRPWRRGLLTRNRQAENSRPLLKWGMLFVRTPCPANSSASMGTWRRSNRLALMKKEASGSM